MCTYTEIMERYGLTNHLRDVENMKLQDENESFQREDKNKQDITKYLTDKRLAKLWHKASTFGFSGKLCMCN